MKASELRGRAIVRLDQAEKIGTVDDLLLDFRTNEVSEFTMRSGMLGGTKYIKAGSVHTVGADAITISDHSVLEDQGLRSSDSPQLAGLSALLGSKIVSEQGTLLGTLGDVMLDDTGLRIVCFELSGNLWDKLTGSAKTFNAVPGIRMGRQLMIVPNAIAQELSGRGGQPAESAAPEPGDLADLSSPSTATLSRDYGSTGDPMEPPTGTSYRPSQGE